MSKPLSRPVSHSQVKTSRCSDFTQKIEHAGARGGRAFNSNPSLGASGPGGREPAVSRRVATIRESGGGGDTGVRRPVRDPSTMTPDQRLTELGGILARGVRRHLVSREQGLDDSGDIERSCDEPVNTPRKPEPEIRIIQ